MKYSTCLLIILFISACNQKQETVQGQWIKGNEQKKLETIENQFRGFDMAMVETGYRYQELYWAGQDENWGYADYQLEKIQKAIENGLERRPKRAQSAQHFLTVTVPQMKEALKKKDTVVFNKNFQVITNSCVSCHAMEKVPFFTVKTPTERQSPIRK
ncbi:hypothetical protein EG344_23610 [Chryseobacterium sp. G0162]|uniref:hypothetical protein n=1 Tax=Chryseobacterium TaxID=59732 RepID=UPI000EBA47A4|nr:MULTISPECIES: hypothetical protein [Chryseobacterium]MDV3793715.1 hypothetical protein [Elizabethkingia anophelis]HAF33726.1 hypothetical protein [Sphingobacterium sp.]AZA56486.1 hypothetical protein EG350_04535 [Chryseobacterium shandongense]AZB11599.1 hypothetical protein EG344_23610 [Chryseobacterium sp. G0162]MDV3830883.1 hypothetical protein [Elizabethkingia anophelis]